MKAFFAAWLVLAAVAPVALAQAQVTLAWDTNTDSTVIGYRLYQGGASRTYTNVIDVGDLTSATVTNLLPGGTYFFAVTDYNDSGLESDYSAEVTYTVPLSSPPPVSPPSVVLTSPAPGATYSAPATLNLSASVVTNGHTITQVQFYNGTALLGADTVPPYVLTWSGVSAGTYSLSAQVIYDGGSSVGSTAVSVTVTNPLPLLPPSVVLTSPAAGATYSAPATVNLSASVVTNGHTITQVQFYNGTTLLGSDAVPPYVLAWSGVSAGTYSLTAQVVYDSGSSAGSTAVSISVTNPPPVLALPAPWQTMDIGSVGVAGSAGASNGLFTVAGAGTIGGTIDSCRFVYQPLSADGEIRAQICASQNLANDWAGVMIRESLTPGSAYGLMGVVSGNAIRLQSRNNTGSNSKSTSAGSGAPPNLWVRLVRTGNTLYGYKSTDGVNWGTAVGRYKVPMASNVYIGLAVASGSTNLLNTAGFSSLTVVP